MYNLLLSYIRQSRDMSFEQMAKLLGFSANDYIELENGNRMPTFEEVFTMEMRLNSRGSHQIHRAVMFTFDFQKLKTENQMMREQNRELVFLNAALKQDGEIITALESAIKKLEQENAMLKAKGK